MFGTALSLCPHHPFAHPCRNPSTYTAIHPPSAPIVHHKHHHKPADPPPGNRSSPSTEPPSPMPGPATTLPPDIDLGPAVLLPADDGGQIEVPLLRPPAGPPPPKPPAPPVPIPLLLAPTPPPVPSINNRQFSIPLNRASVGEKAFRCRRRMRNMSVLRDHSRIVHHGRHPQPPSMMTHWGSETSHTILNHTISR